MKTLFIMRHGKSDWAAGAETDRDRPLSRRGRKAASRMGGWFVGMDHPPELVLSSPARRAADTAQRFLDGAGWLLPLSYTESLYEADAERWLAVLQGLDDGLHRVMAVGHEPGCSEIAAALIGGGAIRFPTATIARIDLSVASWADVGAGDGTLVWLMPVRLPGDDAQD
jgi:phosphohistidine phosphatase